MSNTWNKKFKAGDCIFREGDTGNKAYIIDSGTVEIRLQQKDTAKIISTLKRGEIFGEMAIIDGSPRSADAFATEDTLLTCISKDQLIERVKKADPAISFLITVLLNRIRSNLKSISKNKTIKEELFNIGNDKEDDNSFIDKMKFENELIEALNNEEFTMFLQPIINIYDQEVKGFEALIRWISPVRGFVPPDVFLGTAEETSLIIPLGQWVLQNACFQFAKVLKHTGRDDLFVSINVSGKQLQDEEFFTVLDKAIKNEGIKASQIKLEVTESILVEGDIVLDWLKKSKAKGYTIALDDFGTGYSSLSYLSRLAVDNIKIDKSFTQAMHEDPKAYVIVKAIIEMAQGLKVPIIAEGIETEEQYKALKYLGCEYGQGYLYSKPLASEEIIAWLDTYKKIA